MIDTRLITFLEVAKTKNITRAASILNLTQPAVSQQIKYLEEYYDINLLKKDGRSIDLTEEGKIFYKYAKEMEILSRDIEHTLENKKSIVKRYNMGATMTIGGYVLPFLLGKYKEDNENIDIILQVENTRKILDSLRNKYIDLALVEGPFDKEKFLYKKFKDDELVLAVPLSHKFTKRSEVSIEEILKGNLILRESGSGTRDIIEYYFRDKGYTLNDDKIYMEIGNISAIISLVQSNLGYTIISKEAIKKEVEYGNMKIVPIKDSRIKREFNFVYLEDSPREFIEDFIDFCLSI